MTLLDPFLVNLVGILPSDPNASFRWSWKKRLLMPKMTPNFRLNFSIC